ncbi:unnamed protein product [Schistosoma intercalatum]|nr:unnamed protein product [Schistosoma intercalatum]
MCFSKSPKDKCYILNRSQRNHYSSINLYTNRLSAVQFNIDDTQGHDLKLLSPHATLAPYLLHLQNIVSPQPSSVCSVGIRGEPDNNN